MSAVDNKCELQFATQASFDATNEKYAELKEELSSACKEYTRASVTTASTIVDRLHFRGIDRNPEPCCVCLSTDITSMLRFRCGHHVCTTCYVGCYLVRNMTPCFLCNDARTTTTPKTPITCQSGVMHTLFMKAKVRDWIAYFVNISTVASNPYARGGLVSWLDFTLRMAHPRNAVEAAHMRFAMEILKPLKDTVLAIALNNVFMTTFYSNIQCVAGPSFTVKVAGKTTTVMVDKISRKLETHVMSTNTQRFMKQLNEKMSVVQADRKSSVAAPSVDPTTKKHTNAHLGPHDGAPPKSADLPPSTAHGLVEKQPTNAPLETSFDMSSDDAKMKLLEARMSSLHTPAYEAANDADHSLDNPADDAPSFFDVSKFSLPEYALILAGLMFAAHKL